MMNFHYSYLSLIDFISRFFVGAGLGTAAERNFNMAANPTVVVGGVETACLSRIGIIQLMIGDCTRGRTEPKECKLVFDLNGHGVALSRSNAAYRRCLLEADVVHADGQPIVFASRLLTRNPIPREARRRICFMTPPPPPPRTAFDFICSGRPKTSSTRGAQPQ